MASAAKPILVGPEHKGFSPRAWGMSIPDFVAASPRVGDQQTPLLTLDAAALEHNVAQMFAWLGTAGLAIAPHGKTTMAPALWARLADAGAWGITVATGWQAQVARSAGVDRVMIANTVVDPVALRWLADELNAHPEAEVISWVDDIRTVELMSTALRAAGLRRRLPVIVELGAAGGRTGVRGVPEAMRLARIVHDSAVLELAGVGGYEGALAHDRSSASLARIDAYLDDVARLHREVIDCDLVRDAPPIVTVGGSAYFDRVAARLGALSDAAVVLLRSGAFHVHDDGFYASISPMGELEGTRPFRSAMHLRARVVSRPEERLALLDAGKRDLSFDEGMPVPLYVAGLPAERAAHILAGARIAAVNDQHAFLDLGPHAVGELPVGSVVVLGLSHPCTVLDRWRLIPVVEHPSSGASDARVPACADDDAVIVQAVQTFF